MAGSLTISTLNNDTGVLATQNGMTGIAKAWVNFNGQGTVAIRGSFNVSSITDNGTGDYTINFTTAMPNSNYAAIVGSSANYGARGQAVESVFTGPPWDESAPTTTSFRFTFADDQGSSFDPKYVLATVFSS